MKTTILFDLDGTLTDPGLGITNSVMYALEKLGYEVPAREKLYKYIGPPLSDSFRADYGMTQQQAQHAIDVYREYFSVTGLFENEVYPGIPEMLETLRTGGKKLLLATSKPEKFARRIMEHFDLAKYFAFIGGADLAGTRGTKDRVIEYVLRETGTDAADCVMVGDRLHDAEGAAKFGIPTVGVLWGYGSEEELRSAGCVGIAKTAEELVQLCCTIG